MAYRPTAADRPTLEDLRNIGPRSAAWLRAAGIADPAALHRIGAAGAYLAVKRMHPREATRTLLWALAGALLDMPYTAVPREIRHRLVAEVRGLPLGVEALAGGYVGPPAASDGEDRIS